MDEITFLEENYKCDICGSENAMAFNLIGKLLCVDCARREFHIKDISYDVSEKPCPCNSCGCGKKD